MDDEKIRYTKLKGTPERKALAAFFRRVRQENRFKARAVWRMGNFFSAKIERTIMEELAGGPHVDAA